MFAVAERTLKRNELWIQVICDADFAIFREKNALHVARKDYTLERMIEISNE